MAQYIIDGDRLKSIADVIRMNAGHDIDDDNYKYAVDEMPAALWTMEGPNMCYGGSFRDASTFTAIAGAYGSVEVLTNFKFNENVPTFSRVIHWNITTAPGDSYIRIFYTNPNAVTGFPTRSVQVWTNYWFTANGGTAPINYRMQWGYNPNDLRYKSDESCEAGAIHAGYSSLSWANLAQSTINPQFRLDITGDFTGDFYLLACGVMGANAIMQSDVSLTPYTV